MFAVVGERLRERSAACCFQAIAAVLDDAATKWLAAVSSTSDDAVMGVAWSSGLGRRSGGSRVGPVEHGATRAVTAEDDPGAEHKPSGVRRVLHIVGAVVVVLVLPALVIGAFVGELGVSAMFTGVVLGAVGAKLGGTHRMLYVVPAIGVAGGLGAYTAYDWWWVALLAVAAVVTGAGIRFGWFAALLMVPFAATFVTPVSTVTDAVIYGVILAIASLYGVVLAHWFGAPEIVDGDHLAPRVAAGVAVMFGLVLGGRPTIKITTDWTE